MASELLRGRLARERHEPMRRFLSRLNTAMLLAAVCCGSCRTAQPPDGGIRIGDKTLEQFQVGGTSESWLVSIIGPPTTRVEVPNMDEPTSILRYSVIQRGSGGLFALFSSAEPKTTATIYFVVRSGMVTQFWADREERATLFGKDEKDTGEKKDAQ